LVTRPFSQPVTTGQFISCTSRLTVTNCPFSYSATHYAGPGYRLVGDAGAFIDPFFSSGVHLAISSGLSAAATICSTIRGELTDEVACQWHSAKVGTSYTRSVSLSQAESRRHDDLRALRSFLVVVLAAYRQMHAQNHAVLSDIDEDNFDRAFEHFRPSKQPTLISTSILPFSDAIVYYSHPRTQ